MEDLTGREFGPYRVVSALARGGMASVYTAHQKAVDRLVALKVLSRQFNADPQFLTRFRHEARLLGQLQHPRILAVYDFDENDGYAYIAMELAAGGTLGAAVRRRAISLSGALRIIGQICDALDYAHSKGVVHRDIKPNNILLDERHNCLVADFGIARIVEDVAHITLSGAVMGTPAYMSPEQITGTNVGPASDVYAVGVVLYELLAGRVPFLGDTPAAVMMQHLSASPPPPRTLNPALSLELEAVVLKALARDLGNRFSTARELHGALASAVRGLPQGKLSEPLPEHVDVNASGMFSTIGSDAFLDVSPTPPRRGTRAQTIATVAFVCVLSLGATGTFVFPNRLHGPSPSEPPPRTAPFSDQAPKGPPVVLPDAQSSPAEKPIREVAKQRDLDREGETRVSGRAPHPPTAVTTHSETTSSDTSAAVSTIGSEVRPDVSGPSKSAEPEGRGGLSLPPPIDATGRLQIHTSPGAEVLVDNASRGVTNPQGLLLVPDLASGPHDIRILLEGRQFRHTSVVQAGEESTLDARLDPPAVIPSLPTAAPPGVRLLLFHFVDGNWHFGILTTSPGRIAWTETETAGYSLGQIGGFNTQSIEPGLHMDNFVASCAEVLEVGNNLAIVGEHIRLRTRNYNFAMATKNKDGRLVPKSNSAIPGLHQAAEEACHGVVK